VSGALNTLTQRAAALGLSLNLGKCELITTTNTTPDGLDHLFPEALLKDTKPTSPTYGHSRVLLNGEFEILGAPVGSHTFCAAHTNDRVNKVLPALTALSELDDPQVALRLQRRCQGFAKLGYSARVMPGTAHLTELHAFDAMQRDTFSGYMGWTPSDSQWAQATRGYWCAGLGLRSAAKHAAPAYIASYNATLKHCRELDPNYQWEGSNPDSDLGRSQQSFNATVADTDRLATDAEPAAPSRQQTLSRAVDKKSHDEFLGSLNDSDKKALLSEMLPGASGFLEAVPSKDLGLAWEPSEFVTEIRTRLLDNLFPDDDWCPACDSVLDSKGRHPAVCACGGDRTRRHHAARNRVGLFAAAAGLNPELEKPGLLQPCPEQPGAARRRPADVFIPSWSAALDLAITSPQRLDAPPEAVTTPGAAAEAYERHKRAYLNTAEDCATQGLQFRPIVGEPSGGWGPSAMCTFKAIAKAHAAGSHQDAGSILALELQHLCTAVRRANARAVLSRGCDTSAFPSSACAHAAAILQSPED
jgi:hypothetical protein